MIWQDSPSSLKPICELNEQGGDERALGLELLESSWPRASPTHIFPKTAPKLLTLHLPCTRLATVATCSGVSDPQLLL